MRIVETSIDLPLRPEEVLMAFTHQKHLQAWWNVSRSLVELHKGGMYTLVWQGNDSGIEYVTTGTVAEYLPGCQLKVENLVYINPQRPVLGPMELLILTTPQEDDTTHLTVIQSGYKEGPDWDWLYFAVQKAWPAVLDQARKYLLSIA